jgi:tripartite ATP-independent transporter DctM subunit
MGNDFAVWLLLGSFALFIVIRLPIAFSIGLSTVITTLYLGLPLQTVAQGMVKGIDSFVLLAVPFFILAGEIMSEGGISNRLIQFSNALVGHFRGGLASVNILASMFFGGISGSSTADTSSIGALLIPMMKKQGYDEDFATTVTMSGSVQGILIPPSHNMVIYSLVAGGVSIGKLFLAGMIPGVFLGLALMVYSYFVSVKRNYPVGERATFKQILSSFRGSILGLLTVIIVVGGVISGFFTATESAAIATVYAFIITFFVFREIPLLRMNAILGRSLKTLAIVLILIGTSSSFGWLLAYLRVPAMVAGGILGLTHNKIMVLVIVNLILLFLGMIMDMSSIILIATPILLPIMLQVGVDPVHFGIMMMLNLGIGLLTPPVGGTLFIGSAISKIPIEKLSKSMLPFYGVMIVVLLLITYIPQITMFLPNLLMP